MKSYFFNPSNTNIQNISTTYIEPGAKVTITDHLGGFDSGLKNEILDYLSKSQKELTVESEYIFDERIKNNYKELTFITSTELLCKYNSYYTFENYRSHPKVDIKNFLCSFNGSAHVSRKLLTACLHKLGLFEPNYSSKNFTSSIDEIEGYLLDLCVNDRFYRKFFVSKSSQNFLDTIYSFGHVQYDHKNNIYNLEKKLTGSFVHIVSETMATSYYPFVTEKFLYSVVTRGLFLSYAQPGWHAHIEKYYGFKFYTKLFDYRFDFIQNPIERLIELLTMISKFSKLSYNDLYDLYLMELDTVNYNYEHYFSGKYLDCLKQYDTSN